MLFGFDGKNFPFIGVSDLDDFFDILSGVGFQKFPHMSKAVDIIVKIYERSEVVDFSHLAVIGFSGLVFFFGRDPGIFFKSFDGKRNTSVVNADDFGFHFVAGFDDVARIVDELPGEFRNMHQALQACLLRGWNLLCLAAGI